MVSSVTIVAGPARSGKTERVLSIYRRALAEGPLGSALWLSPTRRAVDQVREQLSDGCLPACLRPNCFTFDQLANVSLETAPIAVRPITELMKRELLGRLIRQAVEAGRMEYFAPIAHTAGMLELLSGFITELKRLEIWPEQFNEACRQQGRTAHQE
jgi:ATP-dependent helicase/DNAse subunit B